MQIALEALSSGQTLQQLADKYAISIKNIMNWKQQFLGNASLAFNDIAQEKSTDELKKENANLEKRLQQLKKEYAFVMRNLKTFNL